MAAVLAISAVQEHRREPRYRVEKPIFAPARRKLCAPISGKGPGPRQRGFGFGHEAPHDLAIMHLTYRSKTPM